MNLRTRQIQAIACCLCKGYAWHDRHQPVRVGVAWHHPRCRNVIGPNRLGDLTSDVVRQLRARRPRALRP
jgi:hypothetical protein